jgi:primase-polymerase (primpol)-like protein
VYDGPAATPAADAFRQADADLSAVPAASAAGETLTDDEVLRRAMAAKNGDKFKRLWEGDTSGYSSDSEADLALCSLLSYWTGGDRQRVDRLMARGALGQREKWATRPDYRERTINKALQG